MSDLVRCVTPAVDNKPAQTCIGCECRSVPAKDGAPVMTGRLDPSGYCQDRQPPLPGLLYGWLAKP